MAAVTHIFFDFFGTLVQYSKDRRGEAHADSFRLLADNGYEFSYEAYLNAWEATFDCFDRKASGSLDEFSMDQLCGHFLNRELRADHDSHLVREFRDAYLDEWSRGISYISRLDVMLDELASRHCLAVVSNTHHEQLVTAQLHSAGIAQYFSGVFTSVAFGRRKPCPTFYRHALAATRSREDVAMFVGDSFAQDYAGPRAVGLYSLLIDPGGREQIPDEHRLFDVLELRDRIGG